MSCPLDADLSALLDGDLPAWQDRRIRSHLGRCGRCREALESLTALRRSLGMLSALSPLGNFDELWRMRIAEKAKQSRHVARPLARLIGHLGTKWTLGAIGAGLGCALLFEPRLRDVTVSNDEIVVNAERAFRHADLKYQVALAKLKRTSGRARLHLVEDERQKFDAALSELESATDRCRQVALGRPADPEAEALLFSAYRRQIRFFEDQLLAASSQ